MTQALKRSPSPKEKRSNRSRLSKPILDADVVITVPKLKNAYDDVLLRGSKNMFGAVPGIYKAEYHFSAAAEEDFALCRRFVPADPPYACNYDAIWGDEGEGPSGGVQKAYRRGCLPSANPYALDLAATALVGITPDEAPTIAESIAWSCAPASIGGCALAGDNFEAMKIHDLVKPPLGTPDFLDRNGFPKRLSHALNAYLAPIPRFDTHVCVGCGECMRRCPAKQLR